jgi:hypothetical protein
VRVLFDQGVPVPLRSHLSHHKVVTVFEMGWSTLQNEELLSRTEAHGFEVFLTTDRSLKYQQNLAKRTLAIVVLLSTSWPKIRLHAERVAAAVESATPGSYVEVTF